MRGRNFLLGAAGGFVAGYALYRLGQAVRRQERPAIQRDAARYGAMRRRLTLAAIARSLAGTAAVAYGPLGELLDASTAVLPVALRPAVFALEGALLDAALDFASDYVENYELEHRYELSDQSFDSWMSDKLKEEALGAGVTMLMSTIFSGALRRWPNAWPYVASAGVFPVLLAANVIVPIYVLPMFNRYTALEGPIEKRLRALADRYGVGDAEILRMDMSKQTKKANAFVIGIFNTHRIVVGDTLLENFSEDEIEFVVAHELGHYVARDSWRLIAAAQLSATALLFACFLFQRDRSAEALARPSTLARITWCSMLLSQGLRPAMSAFARSREWAADRFALQATQSPQTGASAFRRLRDQNLAEDEQPGWYEFLFATHPSLRKRIAALERSAV